MQTACIIVRRGVTTKNGFSSKPNRKRQARAVQSVWSKKRTRYLRKPGVRFNRAPTTACVGSCLTADFRGSQTVCKTFLALVRIVYSTPRGNPAGSDDLSTKTVVNDD